MRARVAVVATALALSALGAAGSARGTTGSIPSAPATRSAREAVARGVLLARLGQQRARASVLSNAIAAVRAAQAGAHVGGPKITAALELLSVQLTAARRSVAALQAELAATTKVRSHAVRTNAVRGHARPAAQRSRRVTARPAATRPVVPPAARLVRVKAGSAPWSGGGAGAVAVAYARAQIGKPYRWGGAGPWAFDCSGLTMRAWEAAGVRLPHLASAQLHDGIRVSRADLRPGDLVFLDGGSHVELYAGGGLVIEAPHSGAVVRYAPLPTSNVTAYVRPAPAV